MNVDTLFSNTIPGKIHFVGLAGSGMSALAQYLVFQQLKVSGSDRSFEAIDNQKTIPFSECGIQCFPQDGSGIDASTSLIIVSSAIEESNPDLQKARSFQIPILKRSELLSIVARQKKTIAISGTSGKSTTAAMLFEILRFAGLKPSIITGAGLIELINQGKIGNAAFDSGDFLVIEADESDGSIVQYSVDTGLLLNIEKDHKEIEELIALFKVFQHNCVHFILNRSEKSGTQLLARESDVRFSIDTPDADFKADGFAQESFSIAFTINGVPFKFPAIGRHNMENALAATTAACTLGVSIETASKALSGYKGIYRRNQILGIKNGCIVIDDYAHNPAKVSAAINGCKSIAMRIVCWFQPHGYGPTRFLQKEFIQEIAAALRESDEIWMSEIYYAGGTAVKDISSLDLIEGIQKLGRNASFVKNRSELPLIFKSKAKPGTVLLLMGARDPSLEDFAKEVFEAI